MSQEVIDMGVEEQIEEKVDEKEPSTTKERDLLNEMRGLLNNYPNAIIIKEKLDTIGIVHNMCLIYDLLKFCRYKTLKDDIREKINEELGLMESKLKINEIKQLYRQVIESNISWGMSHKMTRLNNLIDEEIVFISEKVQYYLLAIPNKGKPYMHLKTAQGLPAATADSYESSEIKDGESIDKDTSFKIGEEGEIIPV